jgi:hypothetical protein
MPHDLNPPPQGPLARIIASIVAVFALLGFFVLGLAALLVIGGVVLVAGLVIWMRVAWIKRRLQKSGVNLGAEAGVSRKSSNVIDAEYTVVPDSDNQKDE